MRLKSQTFGVNQSEGQRQKLGEFGKKRCAPKKNNTNRGACARKGGRKRGRDTCGDTGRKVVCMYVVCNGVCKFGQMERPVCFNGGPIAFLFFWPHSALVQSKAGGEEEAAARGSGARLF